MSWKANLLIFVLCFAFEAQALQLGHNLSSTSYTLRKGEITAGNYFAGVGITDGLLIGTSPWMVVAYNMPTLGMRYAFRGDELIQRFAFDFCYFKTMEYGWNTYRQESFFARVTGTHRFSPGYVFHLSGGYQHFFNSDAPYSLHRTISSGDPTSLSVGVLHEINLSGSFGFFAETALLGLNYPLTYGHFGLSFFFKPSWGTLQIGLSRTELFRQEGWVTQENGSTVFQRGSSFHPEVQLQFSVN